MLCLCISIHYLPQLVEDLLFHCHPLVLFLLLPSEKLQPPHHCPFPLEFLPFDFDSTISSRRAAFRVLWLL